MKTQSIQIRCGWGIWFTLLGITTPAAIMHCLLQWQSKECYTLPFLFLFSLVLIYFGWNKQVSAPNRTGWVIVFSAAIVTAISLLQWAQLLQLPGLNFGALAFALTASSILASHGMAKLSSQSLLRFSFFLAIWLVFPIEGKWNFVSVLRVWSGSLAGQILDSLSVSNRVHADVFQLTDQSWEMANLIGDAFSTTTLVGIGCLWCAWYIRSYALFPVYISAAILWGVVGDTIRLTAVSLMQEWYARDWSIGWRFQLIGLFGCIVGILLFLSTDRFLRILFKPTDSDDTQGVNPIVRAWNRAFFTMGDSFEKKSGMKIASKRRART